MPDVSDSTSRRVVGTPDAANYCGSSASTFEKLRLTGGGPVYSKLGRRVVYQIEDLDAWLTAVGHRRATIIAPTNNLMISRRATFSRPAPCVLRFEW
jgi:predicted DNA-binding transcriptional regulator AlpA